MRFERLTALTTARSDAVELCGTYCDDLKMTGQLSVDYYCNPN